MSCNILTVISMTQHITGHFQQQFKIQNTQLYNLVVLSVQFQQVMSTAELRVDKIDKSQLLTTEICVDDISDIETTPYWDTLR